MPQRLNINRIVFYLFPLICYWGYSCIFIDVKMWKMIQFVLVPIIFLRVVGLFFRKKNPITQNVIIIFFLTLLSIVMSFVVWQQDLVLGYRTSIGFLSIIFYLFLVKNDFSESQVERLIVLYGVVWIITWLVNMLSPVAVFGLLDAEDINDSRGITRFIIQGDGFLYLLFFLLFNYWSKTKQKKYLFLAVVAFAIIVLQVTRQAIFFCSLVSLYYLFKNQKRIFLCLGIVISLLTFVDVDVPKDSIFSKMIELSQDQYKENSSGNKNIRVEAYEFFFTEFSPNNVAVLFGNGLPHDDSAYGKMYTKIRAVRKIFYSDVGYAAIYMMMGIAGLIAFFRFFVFLVRYPLTNQTYLYAKMFVVYLFLCNSVSFVIGSNIIPMSVALYVLNKDYKEKREGLK